MISDQTAVVGARLTSLQKSVDSGFEQVNRRLDQLNGTVRAHSITLTEHSGHLVQHCGEITEMQQWRRDILATLVRWAMFGLGVAVGFGGILFGIGRAAGWW